MPKYSFYLNKEEDKIILAYGQILADQGLIKKPVNKYKISKYIFRQIIKGYKNKIAVVNQQQIIDEKTPVEKETVEAEEEKVEETDLHKIYKGAR